MGNLNDMPIKEIFTRKIIEAIVRLVILILIIGWSIAIISPFIMIFTWGMVLAIALFPLYEIIRKKINNKKIAATIVILIMIAVIFVPAAFITKSMVKNIAIVKEQISNDNFKIPPPNQSVKEWPAIGEVTYDFWYDVSEHLDVVISNYSDQIKTVGLWLLDNISSAGFGFLQFIISVIVSGILLSYSSESKKFAVEFGTRIVGVKGAEFIEDAIITIRNVARGILGVAFLQAVLFGLGLAIAGVPYAGIWSVICLILAIIQIGLGPVLIPISIYMFMTGDVLTAVLLTIWMVFVSLFDNVVKPIVMGRKAPVPTVVIFIGAIGGFMLNGIIGLFIGAVVLSLGYKIFLWWMRMDDVEA